MPGFRWTDAEKRTLRGLRKAGVSVTAILADPDVLPGRTRDSITQLLRREGWVNQLASERAKTVEHFNREQQQVFNRYLRRNGKCPIEQLAGAWNEWVATRDLPRVSQHLVFYWLKKLRIPHSRADAWNSPYARKKRAQKKEALFTERAASLALRISLELEERKRRASAFRRDHKDVKNHKCGLCENRWPLDTEFFAHLPSSFTFKKESLSGFQTEFCTFCDVSFNWTLQLYRRYDKNVKQLLELRKTQRRLGLDLAAEQFLKQARKERTLAFRDDKTSPRRTCIRCGERWFEDEAHFRKNRGRASGEMTYRAICTYCDAEYERRIDRLRRDGATIELAKLRKERSDFLFLAREKQRKARRTKARARRDEIQNGPVTCTLKICHQCSELWPADFETAAEFWVVGHYESQKAGPTFYLSKICIFCKSDNTAEQRRECQ